MAELTVILWRDIPAQVTATGDAGSARRQLSDRFQQAIDAAAMKGDLTDADAYLDEWRRETRACGDDLEAEVEAEAERLEAAFDRDALVALVRRAGARPAG